MIENSFTNYSKKIVPYLDGSMSQDEVSEFEAYVMTHPELEAQINTKAEEMSLLKSMIPAQSPTYETHDSLESELKQSVFNLLKEDHRTLMNRIQDKWEEFVNR
jgi:hypothetical protein